MPYKDPEAHRERRKSWNALYYQRTKERDAAARRDGGIRNQRKSAELIVLAKTKPCADCGREYPPYVMDFDHLRDKEFLVSQGKRVGYQRLVAEIAKCDVVCANCHRERTHRRKIGA